MVSVCLPSDALLQHLPSYLGFSHLGRGLSLHGCSSKVQSLLLTLDEGYLLTAALPDLHRGIAPLGHLAPTQPRLLGRGVSLHGCSSKAQPLLLTLDEGYLLTTAPPKLERGIAPLGPQAPAQPPLPGLGLLLPTVAPGLGCGAAPLGCRPSGMV